MWSSVVAWQKSVILPFCPYYYMLKLSSLVSLSQHPNSRLNNVQALLEWRRKKCVAQSADTVGVMAVTASAITGKGWQIPPSVWMSHSHGCIPTESIKIQVYQKVIWPGEHCLSHQLKSQILGINFVGVFLELMPKIIIKRKTSKKFKNTGFTGIWHHHWVSLCHFIVPASKYKQEKQPSWREIPKCVIPVTAREPQQKEVAPQHLLERLNSYYNKNISGTCRLLNWKTPIYVYCKGWSRLGPQGADIQEQHQRGGRHNSQSRSWEE